MPLSLSQHDQHQCYSSLLKYIIGIQYGFLEVQEEWFKTNVVSLKFSHCKIVKTVVISDMSCLIELLCYYWMVLQTHTFLCVFFLFFVKIPLKLY